MTAATNPFAQSRLEQLAFRFPGGDDWDANFDRLVQLGMRASIIGRRGTGKSTLLRELHRRLNGKSLLVDVPRCRTWRESARDIITMTRDPDDRSVTRREQWRFVHERLRMLDGETLLLVDGIERLSWIDRMRLLHRRGGGEMVVTLHCRVISLPVWIATRPSAELLDDLLAELCSVDRQQRRRARELFARYRTNIRDVLRQMYDEYDTKVDAREGSRRHNVIAWDDASRSAQRTG